MLRREAELRAHPATQRVLDNIEVNNPEHFHPHVYTATDQNNCMTDDEQYEAILRRIARMKSGGLKAQLRNLGLNSQGSTATLRSANMLASRRKQTRK